MKRFLLPSLLALAFGCSQHIDENNAAQNLSLTFELDTVMVDAGDDVIYLRTGLHQSGLSSDGTTLYNFNDQANLLEVIDMENLGLSHKIQFEQEGPNGTGRVFGFQSVANGSYLLSTFNSMGIFSENGQKEYSFNFSKLPAEVFDEGEMSTPQGVLSEDKKSYYTLYAKGWAGSNGVAKLDIESGELKRIPIDQLAALDRFTIKVHDKSQMEINMVGKYLSCHNGKLLISTSVDNQILIYHPEVDSLSQHNFESKLTSNHPKEFARRDVDTQEEFHEINKAFQKDVFFGKWLFDPAAERFYRLTYLFEKELENQKEYKVVLTVLDKELQQVYEGMTPLKKKYFNPMVKDGQLYLYENINDELGFIVLSINEV